jgi:hypothetical protein
VIGTDYTGSCKSNDAKKGIKCLTYHYVQQYNKADRHIIIEILLKVAFNTIKQTSQICMFYVL